MELKYNFVLYICVGVVLFLILFRFRKKKGYADGKKLSSLAFIEKESTYKTRMAIFKTLVFFTKSLCIIAICASMVLISRPYKTHITTTEENNRDIMLCLDVSTSVDELNETLCDTLIDTVEQLKGERFGIVIFNTSPVVVCPLTDDYEYIIETLTTIKKALKSRNSYFFSYDDDDWMYLYNFISSGTITGNETRGSSLIGTGLAATVNNFAGLGEEGDNRTRVVIISTDNDVMGNEIITMPEAGDILRDRKIVCYGIAPDFIYPDDRQEFQRTVEETGGKLFIEGKSGNVDTIVAEIQKLEATQIETKKEYNDVEYPFVPFMVLLVSASTMIVLAKISKV